MRECEIVAGELYHIFNRGTEKRNIFISQKDYERFIVNMILFNTTENRIKNLSRYDMASAFNKIPDDPLVKIHAFSLMPNHFHMIIEPLMENGIARFMHRLEMSYSKYFNSLFSRSGNLFQGVYKATHVDNDAYRLYLPLYIHLNPLELLESEKDWKKKGIKNKIKALFFLKNYSWSSLNEYLGNNSYPFIARDIFDELYKTPQDWETAIKEWLPEYNQNVLHLV